MTAYVIVLREAPIEDAAEYEQYLAKMPDPSPFKMTPLALYGAVEAVEKAPADGVVLLEFPTVEDAKEWYYSEGYQAAAPHRIKSADYRVMIVEGL
jgi:uncharacterized protein (DUF1330 family)